MKAIAKEVSILSTGLPISYATSAIIRVAEERYDVIKLCITGPEGTPYANGLFFFDIFFPENYPLIPPVFEYLTTGNGAWRANPNLYQSGKVCLSLLNTWSTNQWLPSTSTLLQVILSIQAMIFVTRPYFNEPGYGDPTNSAECLSYNRDVRWNTVRHAMIGNLKNPPVGFEDVVKTFFELKKKRIIQQLNAWKELDCNHQPPFSLEATKLQNELEFLLEAL
ncbi:ubiquitin-conjugating enzyme/RWD-like protein [Globomyces pollinis-pini]|nr:ubiquitin-conjugating enzyme/RWD-like protein [Globomyces pollinis-pini]